MSSETDGFEVVRKQSTRRADPRLTVYQDGNGYLNATAIDRHFEDVDGVQVLIDQDAGRVAFRAASEVNNVDTYSLTHTDAGADIRLRTPLRALGVDLDAIEETRYFDLEPVDGLVVADVSALLVVGDVVGNDDADTDDSKGDATTDATDEATDDVDETTPDTESDSDGGTQSTSPADVPVLEDADDPTTEEKVAAYLHREIEGDGGTLETTCGEIGDAVDEDGRAIPHALKSLDDYEAEKTDKADDGEAAVWAVRPAVADESEDPAAAGTAADETDAGDEPDDELDEAINDVLGDGESGLEEPDEEDVRFWCGFCGQGPFRRESQVEGHHNRNDHPGVHVPRTTDPAEEQLVDGDGPAPTADRSLTPYQRVADWFEQNVPEYQYWKTEDVAIECDITGNEAREALETLSEDLEDYVIEHDGRLWRVRAPTGGGA
ncbi:hypothetical protein [Haloarcula pellucida]|uniref:Uncharacterized protein n=1 Tax=Haloarcula pellucida TaxID=1427151 RepID=A0A830GSZ5_9EURY|nr:hypothetical protein [Halomicroarcula pellucida]MBX0350516.1 hypothetical protein [Halomicroarcula pellucida]GGO03693.1 hypothetical protein GCM10009030_39620 [Halomicroarcula pellucida]